MSFESMDCLKYDEEKGKAKKRETPSSSTDGSESSYLDDEVFDFSSDLNGLCPDLPSNFLEYMLTPENSNNSAMGSSSSSLTPRTAAPAAETTTLETPAQAKPSTPSKPEPLRLVFSDDKYSFNHSHRSMQMKKIKILLVNWNKPATPRVKVTVTATKDPLAVRRVSEFSRASVEVRSTKDDSWVDASQEDGFEMKFDDKSMGKVWSWSPYFQFTHQTQYRSTAKKLSAGAFVLNFFVGEAKLTTHPIPVIHPGSHTNESKGNNAEYNGVKLEPLAEPTPAVTRSAAAKDLPAFKPLQSKRVKSNEEDHRLPEQLLTPEEAILTGSFYRANFPLVAAGCCKKCWLPIEQWTDKQFEVMLEEAPRGLALLGSIGARGAWDDQTMSPELKAVYKVLKNQKAKPSELLSYSETFASFNKDKERYIAMKKSMTPKQKEKNKQIMLELNGLVSELNIADRDFDSTADRDFDSTELGETGTESS